MNDCIFCKIVNKSLPAKIIYEDELILAFPDRFPKAKTHVLVVPKQHIISLKELRHLDQPLIWHLISKLNFIAESLGLQEGFRSVINTGPAGGQSVFHLHVHIMGGSGLSAL